MLETDLSREALFAYIKKNRLRESLWEAEKAAKNWERYGGFERVKDLLLQTVFEPWRFEWKFCSTEAVFLDSTVDRYFLLQFLIEKGMLDRENLEGKIIDIGCHVGATVDALAMYGGEVIGTDCGRFAYESPSGIAIAGHEGRWVVQNQSSCIDKLSLISCFNVGWVEDMSHEGFALALYRDALHSLKPNGQILYTFSDLDRYKRLALLPFSTVVELPADLNEREKYAFTATKRSGEQIG